MEVEARRTQNQAKPKEKKLRTTDMGALAAALDESSAKQAKIARHTERVKQAEQKRLT